VAFFDNSDYITKYYTDRFDTAIDANLFLMSQYGGLVGVLIAGQVICYIYLTLILFSKTDE